MTRIPKVSKRGALIKRCDSLLFSLLKKERGAKCEVCGSVKGIGPAHILPKSSSPRLRYCKENILLLCWLPHHHWLHQNSEHPKAKEVYAFMEKKHGKDWKEGLLILEKLQDRLTTSNLQMLEMALEQLKEKV